MKKLLIIENDADTIDVVSIILESYNNYEVVKSEKILPLEQIAEIKPNVIVLDQMLGDGLGSDLCFKIKEYTPTKHIPVIIMSASLNVEKVVQDCRADAFIAKPFDLDDFVNLIDTLAIQNKNPDSTNQSGSDVN